MTKLENTVFFTFDIDWACDEVLSDTIDIIEAAGVSATFFVTHQTTLLERLRANSAIELGVHPNFNTLLSNWGNACPNWAILAGEEN